MAKTAKKASAGAPAALRVLLIPFAFLFYRAMELFDLRSMEFIRRFMDAWGVKDYTLNMLFALLSLAGLAVLAFSPPRRRWLLALGFALFLAPVWYQGPDKVGAMGARAYTAFEFEPVRLGISLALTLWALVLVRGDAKSEWTKLIVALPLMAANYYCWRSGSAPLDWYGFASVISLSVVAGCAVDMVMNGFSLQALLPVIAVAGEVAGMYLLTRTQSLWITSALGLASAVFLLARSPLKERSLGGVLASLALLLNALLGLMSMNAF